MRLLERVGLPTLDAPMLEAIDRFFAGAVLTLRFEDLASELVPS